MPDPRRPGARARAMRPPEVGVWYVRGFPRELAREMRALAIRRRTHVGTLLVEAVERYLRAQPDWRR